MYFSPTTNSVPARNVPADPGLYPVSPLPGRLHFALRLHFPVSVHRYGIVHAGPLFSPSHTHMQMIISLEPMEVIFETH